MKEAVDSEDGKLWKEAMVDEMASLHKNEAWDLGENLCVYVFYVLCSCIVYFLCFRIRMQVISVRS